MRDANKPAAKKRRKFAVPNFIASRLCVSEVVLPRFSFPANKAAPAGQGGSVSVRTLQAMIGPAKIYFIIFGLLTIVGGVIGFVKAGSTASIIAGSISGILLIVAAFLLPGQLVLGLAIAGLVSLLLAGRFIPAFMKTGQAMPAGLMSVLSVIGVIVAIVAWIKK